MNFSRSVVIGLMELGCAMTWNHDEQFVEGDFPYYPYTNRINAYADTDGLTDSRIRSNEFSGFKTALHRRKFQEKRKSLYAFNKDSNKLIDASKLDNGPVNVELAQTKKLKSSGRERLNSAKARNSGSDESENINSAESELQPAKSEKSVTAEPGNPNSAEAGHLDSKPEEPKSAEHKLEAAKSETSATAGTDSPRAADSEKSDSLGGSEKPNEETELLPGNHIKAETKNGKSMVPSLTVISDKRHRRNSGLTANLAWPHTFGESNSRDLWAHGISRATPSTGSPRRKFARENKPNERSRKLTLVAPYENNFTGGGFHSVNPSSWLAKEIERFIRRKDHRWLDFMKNTGMDVKKYSGVVSDPKQKSGKPNTKVTSCDNCLHPSSAPNGLDDSAKLKTDLLINRIDSLLADLNQFRSSVKNGWSDMNSIKKSREAETSEKLINDDATDRRKHRLRRGIRFSRLSALTRPPARPATDLVENDLRDLRKNVVLYQNRLPEQEMQALEDMKLHIKVYVEKEKDYERENHHTSGSDMDYNEAYPQQINFE